MGEAVHGKLVIKRGSCRNPNSLIPALTYITRRHSMWILKGIESRKRGKSFLFFPAVCEYEYVGREKRVNKRMCGRKKSNIAQHPCCCCPRDDCVPRQSPLDPNFFFFFWLWWVYEKRRAAGSDCRNDWATLWELFGHQWQVLYVLMKLPVVCVPLIEDSPPPSKKGNKQQTTCCCKTTTCGFFFWPKTSILYYENLSEVCVSTGSLPTKKVRRWIDKQRPFFPLQSFDGFIRLPLPASSNIAFLLFYKEEEEGILFILPIFRRAHSVPASPAAATPPPSLAQGLWPSLCNSVCSRMASHSDAFYIFVSYKLVRLLNLQKGKKHFKQLDIHFCPSSSSYRHRCDWVTQSNQRSD